MARSLFRDTLTDRRGNALSAITVEIFNEGTTTPISETIFDTRTGLTTLANPFIANREVTFYLDTGIGDRVDVRYSGARITTKTVTLDGVSPDDFTTLAEAVAAAPVQSFNGRIGDIVPIAADYDGFFTTPSEAAAAAPMQSFNGRIGAVIPIAADYDGFFTTPSEAAAAAPVQSVFGRTGAVVAVAADYAGFFGNLATTNNWLGDQTFSGTNGVLVNVVTERTLNAGVTVDGVLLKDGGVTLAATGTIVHRLGGSGAAVFVTRPSGQAQDRLLMLNTGELFWSDGTAAADVRLSRTAANRLGLAAGDEFQVGSKILPGTDAGAQQTACGIFAGTGVPSDANGNNGDIFFRSDGAALATIYQKRAGAWVGVV